MHVISRKESGDMGTDLLLRSCWRYGLMIALAMFGSRVTDAADKDKDKCKRRLPP
jgi:hypothetical protein